MAGKTKSPAEAGAINQDNFTIMDADSQNVICLRKRRKLCRGHGNSALVRINDKAACILEGFATETGLSVASIASQLIIWAADRTIFTEGGNEDV